MNDLRGNGKAEVKVGSNTSKIVAVAVIAIAIGAIFTYGNATGMWTAPPAQPAVSHAATNEVEPLRPMDQLLRADAQKPAAPAPAKGESPR